MAGHFLHGRPCAHCVSVVVVLATGVTAFAPSPLLPTGHTLFLGRPHAARPSWTPPPSTPGDLAQPHWTLARDDDVARRRHMHHVVRLACNQAKGPEEEESESLYNSAARETDSIDADDFKDEKNKQVARRENHHSRPTKAISKDTNLAWWWIFSGTAPKGPWDLVPYVIVAYFGYRRGTKMWKKYRRYRQELIAEFAYVVNRAAIRPQRARFDYYRTCWRLFRRNMLFTKKRELVAAALYALVKPELEPPRVGAVSDLMTLAKMGDENKTAIFWDHVTARYCKTKMERTQMVWFARRLNIPCPRSYKLAAKDYYSQREFEGALRLVGEAALFESIKNKNKGKRPGALEQDKQGVIDLGLTPDRALHVLSMANQRVKKVRDPRKEYPQKEKWLSDLEDQVRQESGDIEMASDNPDAFKAKLDDKRESDTMIKAECNECGYTLFIAKGREWKFFGDNYKCTNCGAPKSKFTVTEETDDGAGGVYGSL